MVAGGAGGFCGWHFAETVWYSSKIARFLVSELIPRQDLTFPALICSPSFFLILCETLAQKRLAMLPTTGPVVLPL
jgi:hypothetical protein